LPNLSYLSISHNHLRDLTIAGLTNLRILDLSMNQLNDIECLADLTTLEDLDLSENYIGDVSPLAGFDLRHLGLYGNQITHITPLARLINHSVSADGLIMMTWTLEDNPIVDLATVDWGRVRAASFDSPAFPPE
jgi:Leucine-rich repeat (LRR) protein